MSHVFLTLMVIGLVGLLVMALPAFGGHGHGSHGGGQAFGLRGHVGIALRGGHVGAPGARSEIVVADPHSTNLLRFVPSPRAMCSVLALYGAFGNALVRAIHLEFLIAAVVAVGPALVVEWWVVRPVWNLIFRFQGEPSTPLEGLVCTEATAVVPFRNGKGLISVERDGRLVQFSARLVDDQVSVPVKVGDRLRIEDVDAERERVTVTPITGKDSSSQ